MNLADHISANNNSFRVISSEHAEIDVTYFGRNYRLEIKRSLCRMTGERDE